MADQVGSSVKQAVRGPARRFLFLQGPHGPFFDRLARRLTAAGCACWRVGFNRGDQFFWSDRSRYIAHRGGAEDWPAHLRQILKAHQITDIVLYGDTRPIHASAVRIARDAGLQVHVFEEGYLRPFWISYERGGANGHSRLMEMSVADMKAALAEQQQHDHIEAPAHWGDTRSHVFYGALYHALVLWANRSYAGFKPHRALTVAQEFRLYLKRLLLMPAHWAALYAATRRIRRGGFAYHVALLQLEHDASFLHHSGFSSMTEFLKVVIEGFARGAPSHHHLVFKDHPLEDGRVPVRRAVAELAQAHGIAGRVHYLRGGKLAPLLDGARSAVTINSTAGQQVLWRGLPLRAFGAAVYAKPEFVSHQPLAAFFAAPDRPDHDAYLTYRQYLLETSQIPGGYYAARNRAQLYRQMIDIMLAPHDRYCSLGTADAAPSQHLSLVQS
ncbi:MAG: capsule biosynthesis protein CapA [Rhodobacteraceae bacterium]|nr:capsule biosynthesis protein CapA [Paracoccaceae bacterium]